MAELVERIKFIDPVECTVSILHHDKPEIMNRIDIVMLDIDNFEYLTPEDLELFGRNLIQMAEMIKTKYNKYGVLNA